MLRNVDGQPGLAVASTSSVIPQDDPRAAPGAPFAGIVEVNHPGGGCWDGVTPDIRAGDVIRTIAYNPDNTIRTVDQTTTANVIAERPILVQNASSATAADGTVQVHGVAMYHDGSPMNLAQVENRLIANRDLFVFNGRRVIRAGGAGKDGSLAYDANDPTGVHWTATYTGLVQQDVNRVMGLNGFPGSESRAIWLGVQPLAGLELTIYENAADPLASGTVNGPSAAVCFAPSEPFDTQPPLVGTLTATQSGASSVQLSWTAATDNVAVYQYGIYEDGQRIRNVGAAPTSYLVNNVAPGSHTWTVDAVDTASPAAQLSPTFTYNSPWGNRSAASNAVALVQADVTAPSVPLNLVATAGGAGKVSLTWSASKDDVGVTSYGVYRGGIKLADVLAPATSYTDANVAVGTYSDTVDAADAAGNRSAPSAAAIANVTVVADVTPPSTPTGLTATVPDIHVRNIVLSWSAATDNVGVTGYGVYRNGTKIADVAGTVLTYTDTPASSAVYTYTIDAADSAGNRSGQSTSATAAVANDPPLAPHSLIAFPQRDFVSNSGFALSEGPVTVRILRYDPVKLAWVTVSTSTPITPQADPKALPGDPFAGFVEVNHPGGGCWTGVTPDIRPGDILRTTTAQNISDQTTLPSITAYRPIMKTAATTGLADGVIEVHGTAFVRDAAGTVVPLTPAAFENRLIANRDLFDLNGRRVLRAGGAGSDGTLVFDAPGSINWTATYTGIDADDMARALGGTSASTGTVFVGSESRAVWLGRSPLALTELTIYENGVGVVGGPAAGVCTTPQELTGLSSLSAGSLTFADTTSGASSAAQTVTLSNVGGAPLTVSGIARSGYHPGDFVIEPSPASTCLNATLAAATATAPGGSCTVSIHFAPTAAGARSANLEFNDDAGNTPGLVTLAGNGVAAPAPAASLTPTSLTFASQAVGSTGTAQSVTLTNTGTASLSVTSVTITGPFAISTNGCAAKTLVAGAACTVSVTFKPTATGAASGSLSFADNAAGSPQSVALSGNGVAQAVAAPSTPVLSAASDSGTRGDNITNVATPTFTGTAALGTTVSILSDGVSVGSSATSSTGAYSVTSSLLADGSHVVTAQAKDAAGTLGPASAGLTVIIDTVGPVATAPVANLSAGTALKIDPANFANSTIPVSLQWSATDAHGIAGYELQKKVDNMSVVGLTTSNTTGTFGAVTTPAGSTSVSLDLPLGAMVIGKPISLNSYTFQVRACDVAGNCGTFAAGAKFQMLPVDDTLTGPLLNGAGSVGYSGTWTTAPLAGAYNGSVHLTTASGASARLNTVTFTVSADVVWVSTRGPDRGIATVTVDGVAQTVDLYAPTVQPAQVVFASRGLRGTQHQIQVSATGTKNPASLGVRVDLDSFVAIR